MIPIDLPNLFLEPMATAAGNRGADFVKWLVPSPRARQNKALDLTALLRASGCKHPASPAMLSGQRRDCAPVKY
jgi:hypothetical protein